MPLFALSLVFCCSAVAAHTLNQHGMKWIENGVSMSILYVFKRLFTLVIVQSFTSPSPLDPLDFLAPAHTRLFSHWPTLTYIFQKQPKYLCAFISQSKCSLRLFESQINYYITLRTEMTTKKTHTTEATMATPATPTTATQCHNKDNIISISSTSFGLCTRSWLFLLCLFCSFSLHKQAKQSLCNYTEENERKKMKRK